MNQEIKERIELINKGIVPAGYKKTPVGICPVEWEISEIRKFLKIMHGQSQHEVECKNGTYPILGTGGIIGNANSYLYDKPSILIGRKGTIDKPMFIDTPFWTIDTLFYSKIFDNVNIKYLFYIFKIINWLKYDDSTGVPSLSANTIENIKIIVSTNNLEKQKIAEILDCATRQVELQEQIVDKLKVQKKALMQKLLTPQPDWQEVKLGDICEDIYQPQTVPQKEFKNNGYKVYGANGFIGFYDKYNHKEWQVVLSCRGDCGTINKTEPESWINGNAMVLKMEGNELIDKNYFYYQCLATSFKDVIDNSGIPQITRTPLLKKNFRFIKNMKVQKKIANFFINIDKLIELKQKLLEQYKLRQKALMQLLLTGIVRVN